MALVDNRAQTEPNWTTCSVGKIASEDKLSLLSLTSQTDIITIVAGAEEAIFKCSKEDLVEKSPYFQAVIFISPKIIHFNTNATAMKLF